MIENTFDCFFVESQRHQLAIAFCRWPAALLYDRRRWTGRPCAQLLTGWSFMPHRCAEWPPSIEPSCSCRCYKINLQKREVRFFMQHCTPESGRLGRTGEPGGRGKPGRLIRLASSIQHDQRDRLPRQRKAKCQLAVCRSHPFRRAQQRQIRRPLELTILLGRRPSR